jgi:hypothetical protein
MDATYHLTVTGATDMSNKWFVLMAIWVGILFMLGLGVMVLTPCENNKVKVRGIIGYECVAR